jgi:hypothetical protein
MPFILHESPSQQLSFFAADLSLLQHEPSFIEHESPGQQREAMAQHDPVFLLPSFGPAFCARATLDRANASPSMRLITNPLVLFILYLLFKRSLP